MTGELSHWGSSQGQNDQTGVISDELCRVFRSSREGDGTQIRNCFNCPNNCVPEVTLDMHTKAGARNNAKQGQSLFGCTLMVCTLYYALPVLHIYNGRLLCVHKRSLFSIICYPILFPRWYNRFQFQFVTAGAVKTLMWQS